MYTIGIKKVHIKKRTLVQWLTLWIFVLPFFLNCLTSFLKFPSLIKYTLDVAWVGILILALMKSHLTIKKSVFPMACISLVFFLYTAIIYAIRFQSPAYFLWGFRNNFRFYVAFFAFVAYLSEEDLEACFKFMDILFWVNFIVSIFQYAVLGYKYDYLGGIFGVELGANGNTLVFFCIVLTRSVLLTSMGQRKILPCFMQLVAASVVAALAELKVFFLMITVILLLATIMTNFSWRKCILILVMVICLFVGSTLLMSVFGEASALSMENILDLIFAENYASKNDLSRMTAVSFISKSILTDPISQLIGLGLGNCDTSAFAICNTPFFEAHEHLHYNWFSSAFLFLETGYIGLVLYSSFFIACLHGALRKMNTGTGNPLYCRLTVITAVLCVILMIYNSSLRMEIGYLAYFALALPFVSGNKMQKA